MERYTKAIAREAYQIGQYGSPDYQAYIWQIARNIGKGDFRGVWPMTDQILSAGDRAGWRESEHAEQTRLTGGTPLDKQMDLAMFLASDESNHISGRLVGVMDEWKKLKHGTVKPDLYTLRRVQRA